MKFIQKGTEPPEWKEHRTTPGAGFDAIPKLKDALLKEQGYICCYCMSKIKRALTLEEQHERADYTDRELKNDMKVEHLKPRRHREKLLDYSNLMAACKGNFLGISHCDTLKGEEELILNPMDRRLNVESIIKYKSSGEIDVDPAYERDVYQLLNLNHPILRENRKEVLETVIQELKKEGFAKAAILRMHQKYLDRDKAGKFHPYCMFIVKFLEKKLRQHK